MQLRGLAVSMALGAAAGAVAILAMPRNNPTRKLATKAAERVEEATTQLADKLTGEM